MHPPKNKKISDYYIMKTQLHIKNDAYQFSLKSPACLHSVPPQRHLWHPVQ